MSLAAFEYKAVDASGKQVRGSVQAMSTHDAFRKLTGAGLTPIAVTIVKERGSSFSFQRVTELDVIGLTRELAVLVEAKIPLDRGLRSIAEHGGKPEMVKMIRDIAATIESGHPMTSALEKYPKAFSEVYIETIRAGEKTGNLQAVMIHLAEMLERSGESRQQLKRAMTYPCIVMSVVAVAVAVIVVFVVPRFATQFGAAGVDMPLTTRVMQMLGESVKAYWWVYLGGLGAMALALAATWRARAGRLAIERLLLWMPYIGRLIVAVTVGRFTRVVAIALGSGLDVMEAVTIAGKATGRPGFAIECALMADAMRRGQPLAEAMGDTRYIPSFAKRMIGAGKDSKEVASACQLVARHYEQESSNLSKNINTIIEPLLTVAMAGVVMLVALSVFLPMWQMARLNQ
jgi:MSHA biogenesis protein MshG